MASVAMMPTRRSRVACTAARAPGMTTPTMGVEKDACSCGKAAAAAELQATTISLTSKPPVTRSGREGQAPHVGQLPRPVGEVGRVAEVDEVLVGQVDQALVQHGQAAYARIEHAYRPPIGDLASSASLIVRFYQIPRRLLGRRHRPQYGGVDLPPTSTMSATRNAQNRSTITVPMAP